MITGLIVTYLYETLAILNKTDRTLYHSDQKRLVNHQIKNLFMLDFMQVDIQTKLISRKDENNKTITKVEMTQVPIDINHSRDFDHVKIVTTNSLHNLKVPEVHYLVLKKENTLLRTEWIPQSDVNMQIPLNSETIYYAKFDKIIHNVEFFKVYCSKKRNRLLLTYKIKEKEPFVYELFIPSGSCKENQL